MELGPLQTFYYLSFRETIKKKEIIESISLFLSRVPLSNNLFEWKHSYSRVITIKHNLQTHLCYIKYRELRDAQIHNLFKVSYSIKISFYLFILFRSCKRKKKKKKKIREKIRRRLNTGSKKQEK